MNKKDLLKQELIEMFLKERSSLASLSDIVVMKYIEETVEAAFAEDENELLLTLVLTTSEHEALTEALNEECYTGSIEFVNEHGMFKYILTIHKTYILIGCITCHADFLEEELMQCWQLKTENTLSTLKAVKQKLSALLIHEDN